MNPGSVYAIYKDSSGRLWFGTQTGILYYDIFSNSFVTIADLGYNSYITDITEDANHTIWFASQGIDQIWNAMLKDIPDYKFELLLKLQENYKLYLLSNTNDLHWEHCADKFVYKGMQMLGCFTRVFLSYQMHLAKPDAEIFRTVLKEAGIKAEETLFVDDSKDNCQAASLLGIKVFHYVPGDNLEIQLQNFISK